MLSDTIEGRIFLLLEDKLTEIAKAVGKVDANGEIAEDMRAQILGQLLERLNYDRLYQQALSDPELKRTQVKLEAALSNSWEVREVVFDLFQNLEGFSLDEYKPLAYVSTMMQRLKDFLGMAVSDRGWTLHGIDASHYKIHGPETGAEKLTTDRDAANASEALTLLGLDHTLVQAGIARWQSIAPEQVGLAVASRAGEYAMVWLWRVEASTHSGQRQIRLHPIAIDPTGRRLPAIERQIDSIMRAPPTRPVWLTEERKQILSNLAEPALQRELRQRAASGERGGTLPSSSATSNSSQTSIFVASGSLASLGDVLCLKFDEPSARHVHVNDRKYVDLLLPSLRL